MCIIVDACTFASVFDVQSADHAHFHPVLEWLVDGKGKLVYGGTRYRDELRRSPRYLHLFVQFKKAGKIVEIEDAQVDAIQQHLEAYVSNPDFDDAHIVGIVTVSGCLLICTNDKRAIPYLKRVDLYPRGTTRPKIYSSRRNKRLLADAHIAEVCKPTIKGAKLLRMLFAL
jgi:predicted nucleic acid-binding protein